VQAVVRLQVLTGFSEDVFSPYKLRPGVGDCNFCLLLKQIHFCVDYVNSSFYKCLGPIGSAVHCNL